MFVASSFHNGHTIFSIQPNMTSLQIGVDGNHLQFSRHAFTLSPPVFRAPLFSALSYGTPDKTIKLHTEDYQRSSRQECGKEHPKDNKNM
jgi:hypothetical protein